MRKYPVARAYATGLRFFGWACICISAILGIVALFEFLDGLRTVSQHSGYNILSGLLLAVGFYWALIFLAVGLSLIFWGELLQIFIDIEDNTARSAQTLNTIKSRPIASGPLPQARPAGHVDQPNPANELAKLEKLHLDGSITDEEFQELKAKLIKPSGKPYKF